jgi:hypothetical protein
MVASATPLSVSSHNQVQADFQLAIPRITRHARCFFRHVQCQHRRADCISEVVSLCWSWWLRLVRRGKDPTQFVSVIADFAVRAVRAGRRLCGQLKPKDALSERAQQRHRFRVESLPFSTRTGHEELHSVTGQRHLDAYEERLRDNTMTPPDEQAAFRIDWPAWLTTRTERDRRIIADMAVGERTNYLARRFGLSPARVSQLRREYRDDWLLFTGEDQRLEPQAPDRCCR